MDFFVVPTLCFKVLYVLIIISHDRRKIEHFVVTSNPSSALVAQQVREAAPYGEIPKYLLHSNLAVPTILYDYIRCNKYQTNHSFYSFATMNKAML